MKNKFKKMSTIVASYNFYNELKDLNLSPRDIDSYLKEFLRYFERSEDYDLASARVFDDLMPKLSRKSINKFKSFWKEMNKGKTTVHFNEISMDLFLTIKDQLKDELRHQYPAFSSPEEAAYKIAKEYNIFYNDVFHLAFELCNHEVIGGLSKSSSYHSYLKDQGVVEQDTSKIEQAAQEIAQQEKKKGTDWGMILWKIAKVLVITFGITLTAAIAIARKIQEK